MWDFVETQTNVIEAAFQDYTERKDIAILLINQHVSISPPLQTQQCFTLDADGEWNVEVLTIRRSRRRYVLLWIGIKLLSPLSLRFQARSTPTVSVPIQSSLISAGEDR